MGVALVSSSLIDSRMPYPPFALMHLACDIALGQYCTFLLFIARAVV